MEILSGKLGNTNGTGGWQLCAAGQLVYNQADCSQRHAACFASGAATWRQQQAQEDLPTPPLAAHAACGTATRANHIPNSIAATYATTGATGVPTTATTAGPGHIPDTPQPTPTARRPAASWGRWCSPVAAGTQGKPAACAGPSNAGWLGNLESKLWCVEGIVTAHRVSIAD